MPATEEFTRFEEPSRVEDWAVAPGLRDSHKLILNNVDSILRYEEGQRFYADFRVHLPGL